MVKVPYAYTGFSFRMEVWMSVHVIVFAQSKIDLKGTFVNQRGHLRFDIIPFLDRFNVPQMEPLYETH